MLWRHWWCLGQMISFDIICNPVFIYNYDVQNMDFANSRKWFPFSPLLRFANRKWKRNLNVSERCHVIYRGSTGIRTPGRRVTCNLQPRVWYINHSATASRWVLTSAIPAVGVFRLFHKIYWVLGAFVCSIQDLSKKRLYESRPLNNGYRQVSNTRGSEPQNLIVSRLGLQLSLRNILKPGVKPRMKM